MLGPTAGSRGATKRSETPSVPVRRAHRPSGRAALRLCPGQLGGDSSLEGAIACEWPGGECGAGQGVPALQPGRQEGVLWASPITFPVTSHITGCGGRPGPPSPPGWRACSALPGSVPSAPRSCFPQTWSGERKGSWPHRVVGAIQRSTDTEHSEQYQGFEQLTPGSP